MTPNPDGSGLWCQFCGYTRRDPEAMKTANAYQKEAPLTEYDPPARRLELTDEQYHVLNEAWECIQKKDMATAAFVLKTALVRNSNFADAWYLLSLTVTNPDDRREYLEKALAAQPYHEYAWRDKGILDGVIDPGKKPDAEEAPAVIEAASEAQHCPVCAGALAFDAAVGALICGHCGFRPDVGVVRGAASGYDQFEHALLQRRFGFSKEWHIGERMLECQSCCAQLTLLGTTLSTMCPFCDTAHVLVKDTVGSFEEPDALLPFSITREAAAKAVHQTMNPEMRAQVVRGELQGVYLPYWAFDFISDQFMLGNVLVSGVKQPPQAVLYELMPYDLEALIAYDPRYLAQWPAEIYARDVIEASITGWAYIKHAAWRAADGEQLPLIELARTDVDDYRLPDMSWSLQFDTAKVNGLRYRLILLPVWMVTLVLANGLRRPAVVNGQTGEVIISASFIQPQQVIVRPQRRKNVIRPLTSRPIPVPPRKVIRPIAPRRF